MMIALIFAALVSLWEPAFRTFLHEDDVGEYISAVVLIMGAVLIVMALFIYAPEGEGKWVQRIVLSICAVGLFLTGMEEISWFQRLFLFFGYQVPEWLLANNDQGELNFHNRDGATWMFEVAYYVGAVLVLVVSRTILLLPETWPLRRWLVPLLPGPAAFAFGVLSTAFASDTWRIVFIQLSFFLAIGLALAESVRAKASADGATALLFALVVLTTFVTELVFINYPQNNQSSEAREFVISLGLGLYVAEQIFRLRRARLARMT